ncbi:MAG: hypothetical protein KR126chlam3_00378 [Chlamydiae bacterium]|nr:hypothetical protein [Chlamydiota bacterium]
MTRSMTAYARAKSKEILGFSWIVEIHSVNRKMLDIHMHLSRELLFLDLELRKEITESIHRGKLTVKINFAKGRTTLASISLLKKLKSQLTKVAKELRLASEEITLPFLLLQLDRISLEEEFGPKIQSELKKTLRSALQDLIKMKQTEGLALKQDILKRLKTLSTNVAAIEKESKKSPEKYQKKLKKRLTEMLAEAEIDERILREIAIFSEKVDISEEITRIKSHIKQTASLLNSKEESIGRTLDFLTQEMLREINTIAAKTAELNVTKLSIASKAEIEKIREQVQNIE